MAFRSKLVVLAATDTDVFEFPATHDGGALLFIVNGDAASHDVTIKFHKHATGDTTTLGVFEVAAKTAWQFPIKFGLEAADRIIASCASEGVIAYATVIVGGPTPPGNALTGRGAWSDAACYVVNDIVSHGRDAYLALADNTDDQPPSPNWMRLAQGGEDGEPGAPGPVTSTGSVEAARLVIYSDETGNTVEDSGKTVADFATAAQGEMAATAVQPAAIATMATLDAENQPLTGGATVTSKSLGTTLSGTRTLDVGDCPLQHYTNNGAHTLAPGSITGSALIDITNGASAGAITTSDFTKVSGSPFTTTNGHKFRCHVSVGSGGSLLIVQALQ